MNPCLFWRTLLWYFLFKRRYHICLEHLSYSAYTQIDENTRMLIHIYSCLTVWCFQRVKFHHERDPYNNDCKNVCDQTGQPQMSVLNLTFKPKHLNDQFLIAVQGKVDTVSLEGDSPLLSAHVQWQKFQINNLYSCVPNKICPDLDFFRLSEHLLNFPNFNRLSFCKVLLKITNITLSNM